MGISRLESPGYKRHSLSMLRRRLHLERGVVVAVDDSAGAELASEHVGQNQRVERQQ